MGAICSPTYCTFHIYLSLPSLLYLLYMHLKPNTGRLYTIVETVAEVYLALLHGHFRQIKNILGVCVFITANSMQCFGTYLEVKVT